MIDQPPSRKSLVGIAVVCLLKVLMSPYDANGQNNDENTPSQQKLQKFVIYPQFDDHNNGLLKQVVIVNESRGEVHTTLTLLRDQSHKLKAVKVDGIDFDLELDAENSALELVNQVGKSQEAVDVIIELAVREMKKALTRESPPAEDQTDLDDVEANLGGRMFDSERVKDKTKRKQERWDRVYMGGNVMKNIGLIVFLGSAMGIMVNAGVPAVVVEGSIYVLVLSFATKRLASLLSKINQRKYNKAVREQEHCASLLKQRKFIKGSLTEFM